MKIREKLFFSLLIIIAIFLISSSAAIVFNLQSQTETDRLDMAYGILQQMLICYDNTMSDISASTLERCRGEYLASELVNSNNAVLRVNLRLKLDTIIYNSTYLVDGFLIDEEGDLFYSSGNQNRAYYTQQHENGLFHTDRDISWIVDEENRLFLKCNLYQIFPYTVVGTAVFEIDREYLRSLIGVENLEQGETLILDEYGTTMLRSHDSPAHQALQNKLITQIRLGEKIPHLLEFEGEEFFVVMAKGSRSRWNAIYTVEKTVMLASFYELRNYISILSLILALAAVIISYWFAQVFSGKIRKLQRYINNFRGEKEQNLSYRIPDIGGDEIGDLAKDFNGLLAQIEELHMRIMDESRARQKSKYDMLEFKYRSLQAQISPHFLCNIMSSLSLLASTGNTARVERLAVDASNYLRDNLRCNDRRFNSIQEEIRLVTEYVQIANTISAVPIQLEVDCDQEIHNAIVPSMILQPLVENSIKHGIPPRREDAFQIYISIKAMDAAKIRLVIRDNGVGYRQSVISSLEKIRQDTNFRSKEIGFGTAGVIHRLELQYEKDYLFHIENAPQGGAVTTMEIPLEE